MRIAYLCFDDGIAIDGNKGASVHLQQMVRALAHLGHELLVIVAKGDGGSKISPNVAVKVLPDDPFHSVLINSFKESYSKPGYCTYQDIEQFTYHLVHQSYVMDLLHQFQPEVLYERYSLWGWTGTTISQQLNVPIILEINAPLAQEATKWRGLCATKVAENIEKQVFSRADLCLTVSEVLRSYVAQLCGRLDRIVTLPNAADPELFNPDISCTDEFSQGEKSKFIIGYVGSFKPWQDLETLLFGFFRFVRKIKDSHLLMVGTGPLENRARELARKLGVHKQITFLGSVPYSKIPQYISAMDVAVVPFKKSDFFYFSPIKMFEYMAMGKCVIASSIGQIAEIIDHKSTGWLFPPEDVEGFINALDVLYGNPDLRLSIGKKARDLIIQKFTWQHNALRVTDLLASLQR